MAALRTIGGPAMPGADRPSVPPGARAFTILEALVVLLLVAVLTALVLGLMRKNGLLPIGKDKPEAQPPPAASGNPAGESRAAPAR